MLGDTYSLLPNIQKVVRRAYDQYGRAVETSADNSVYVSAANNMLRTYLTTRDRDLKVLTQHDLEEYQKAVKSLSVETASRNYIKQVFERIYNEHGIIVKVFGLEPTWSSSPTSAFQEMKQVNTTMAHPGNVAPLGNKLRAILQTSGLDSICSVVGWLANEYAITEYEEDEDVASAKYREYAARLLVHHLWQFTDSEFDAEIAKSISKATVQDSDLKIGPVVDKVASSNTHPLVKKAIELLSMFDRAMPKERSVSCIIRRLF